MKSVRQISVAACVLVVIVRVAIGWQFLYEGLWKLTSLRTSQPWSAEGYLKNAQGPLRGFFRSMVDDPDGLRKLDYDSVATDWDAWHNRFLLHYPNLTEIQKRDMNIYINGASLWTEPLKELPPGVDFDKLDLPKLSKIPLPKGSFVKYNEKERRLETNFHWLPKERDALLALVAPKTDEATELTETAKPVTPASTIPTPTTPTPSTPTTDTPTTKPAEPKPADGGKEPKPAPVEKPITDGSGACGEDEPKPDAKPSESKSADDSKPETPAADKKVVDAYRTAIRKLYDRSVKLSQKERLQVLLKEDPDRAGQILEKHEGTVDYKRPGEIQIYRHLLQRYEANLKQAKVGFHHEHLAKQWRDIQEKRVSLIGPVDALTADLQVFASKIVDLAQSRRGPVPPAPSKMTRINLMTTWALIIIGVLLMIGFFTRTAAFLGGGLVLMFYLAMPPLPGYPEIPGPEHALFINKNLIEVLALWALALIRSGRWMGLDSLVRRFILGQKDTE